MSTKKIGIALIGAGIFAKKAYVPSLDELSDLFSVVAVFSKTETSATALAALFKKHKPEVYHGDGFGAVLQRTDVQALVIVLPIGQVTTGAVLQAFKAGKHVLSEKPITSSVKDGLELIRHYERIYSDCKIIWGVAENWNYLDSINKATKLVQSGELGKPLFSELVCKFHIKADNPYLETEWRKNPSFNGGFLLDGGVHQIAALRKIMGNVDKIGAISSSYKTNLGPVDSFVSTVKFSNGALGTILMTFAYGPVPIEPVEITITCEKATLKVTRNSLKVHYEDRNENIPVDEDNSVLHELKAFGEYVNGAGGEIYSPRDALEDVAIVETILKSSEEHAFLPAPKIITIDSPISM